MRKSKFFCLLFLLFFGFAFFVFAQPIKKEAAHFSSGVTDINSIIYLTGELIDDSNVIYKFKCEGDLNTRLDFNVESIGKNNFYQKCDTNSVNNLKCGPAEASINLLIKTCPPSSPKRITASLTSNSTDCFVCARSFFIFFAEKKAVEPIPEYSPALILGVLAIAIFILRKKK